MSAPLAHKGGASPSGRATRASHQALTGLDRSAGIPDAWRCGHPRTPENTKTVRAGTGTACKICFREMNRKWMARKRAEAKHDAEELTRFASRFMPALRWLDQDGGWTKGPAPWTISNALCAARRNGLVASRQYKRWGNPTNDWKLTPLGEAALAFARNLARARGEHD